MKRRPLLDVGAAFVLGGSLATIAASCSRREGLSHVEPRGDTRARVTKADIVPDRAPARETDRSLEGFHVTKHEPSLVTDAHHYCRSLNEEVAQCVILDGADIVGVEYVLSERLFESLSDDEKTMWHPHDSGQPTGYGKAWRLWDTERGGPSAARPLPLGRPVLGWPSRHATPRGAAPERR